MFTLTKQRLGTPLALTISNSVGQLQKYPISLYTFFQIRKMLENLTITVRRGRIKKPLITFQYCKRNSYFPVTPVNTYLRFAHFFLVILVSPPIFVSGNTFHKTPLRILSFFLI